MVSPVTIGRMEHGTLPDSKNKTKLKTIPTHDTPTQHRI